MDLMSYHLTMRFVRFTVGETVQKETAVPA